MRVREEKEEGEKRGREEGERRGGEKRERRVKGRKCEYPPIKQSIDQSTKPLDRKAF